MKPNNDVKTSPEALALQKSEAFVQLRKQWSQFAPVPRAELVLNVQGEGHSVLTIARNLAKDQKTIQRDISIARLPEPYKERIWNGESITAVLQDFRKTVAHTPPASQPAVPSVPSASTSAPTDSSRPMYSTPGFRRPFSLEEVRERHAQYMQECAELNKLDAEAMRDQKYRK